MKKLLIVLMPVLVATGAANAQSLQGYYWYFSNPGGFTSVPGAGGSTASYELSKVGTGTITAQKLENLSGVGSCPGFINVARYTVASGLEFDNSPQLITDSYTIEMTVNVASIPNNVRLLGFSSNTKDSGIYITTGGGGIYFRDGLTPQGPVIPISANRWYDIVFTRNGATNDIRVYVNGNLLPEVIHDPNGVWKPQPGNGNRITFLKDDLSDPGEETNGMLAKVSIFNKELTQTQVSKLYNEVCSAEEILNLLPQGYQWSFAGTPYKAVGTDAYSALYASKYALSNSGNSTSIAASTVGVGLGNSCTAGISVANVPLFAGLQFNQTPQFIDKSYTMELVFKGVTTAYTPYKLATFNGSFGAISVSVNSSNAIDGINFYNGSKNLINFPSIAADNVWFSFVFTRDAATKDINVYINNAYIGTYNDADDVFVPHGGAGNMITFLNDYIQGQIAKLSLFNVVLNTDQLTARYNNICGSNLIVLPVTLKNFNAQKAGTKVNLSWTTATEQNHKGFEVQRSADGSAYSSIGFVNGAGNSATDITYHFTDASPLSGKSYYRLKQINLDNQFKFSVIRLIDFAKDVQDLQVYPNPTHSTLTIVNLKAGNALRIFDSFGRFVYGKNITDTEETIPVDKLAAGVYVLQVTDGNGDKRSVRFTRF